MIVLQRSEAIGDVLLTTPIVKRLFETRKEQVTVITKIPQIFKNSPYVITLMHPPYNGDKINLDGVYERSPRTHIIDSYSSFVFNDVLTPHKLDLFTTPQDTASVIKKLGAFCGKAFAVIHPGVGWENRTFPAKFWMDISDGLNKRDIKTIMVGGGADRHFIDAPQKRMNLKGKLTIHELSALVKEAVCFIGPDSAPLHIAQTTNTPVFGVYTCAKAQYRSVKAIEIKPDLDCYGCLADEPPPVFYCGCRKGDFACVNGNIKAEDVLKRIEEELDA